jgi:putative ABC transport system substrate-binding protein
LLVALALPVLLISANIHAQSAPRRVGVLVASSQTDRASQVQVAAVRKALSDLGYVEGRDVVIVPVYAEGKPERAADLALGLVRLPVDVALTATIPNALALQKASATLPIVIAAGGDLVGSHLAASGERPGGTITGVDQLPPGITGKRLGLLKEVSPGITRVAILSTAPSASHALQSSDAETAAKDLGISLRIYQVRRAAELPGVFEAIRQGGADGLLLFFGGLSIQERKPIVDFAAKQRIPAMYGVDDFVDAGGLMSYGPSLPDLFRQATAYVDKILKGAKPGDLAISYPKRIYLTVNLKTAAALGLTISPSLLSKADQVIR